MTGGLSGHLIRGICSGDTDRLLYETIIVLYVGIPVFVAAKIYIQFVVLNSLFELFKCLLGCHETQVHIYPLAKAHMRRTPGHL